MTDNQREWAIAKEELDTEMRKLGYPADLSDAIARQLGSPKAIRRMTAYLYNVKPRNVELVVDEMLAIFSEIAAWKEKKASEAANARYNEILYYGLDNDN